MSDDDRIRLEATVVTFTPDAMHDSYEDGGGASYDATRLRILSPGRFQGKEITIFHNRKIEGESIWKKAGATIGFSTREEYLNGRMVLFSGAVDLDAE